MLRAVIFTRWHPVTLHRGSFYSADNGDFRSYQPENPGLSMDENHEAVLRAFCKKRNWHGHLTCGLDSRKCRRVWVWVEFQQSDAMEHNPSLVIV